MADLSHVQGLKLLDGPLAVGDEFIHYTWSPFMWHDWKYKCLGLLRDAGKVHLRQGTNYLTCSEWSFIADGGWYLLNKKYGQTDRRTGFGKFIQRIEDGSS